MSGTAVISGNKAREGGGVEVRDNNSKFTMSSGEIKGNEAERGGGVRVDRAEFIKSGGTIYGSDNATSKNTATNDNDGHAVKLVGGGNTDKKRNTTVGTDAAGKLYAKCTEVSHDNWTWTYTDDGGTYAESNWDE
jgi:hypothetical protein